MSVLTRSGREARAQQWRERIAGQQRSGQSVAAYCRDAGIAVQTFYGWKARLGKAAVAPAERAQGKGAGTPFIDLCALSTSCREARGLDIRLELPGGVVLTIAGR